MVGAKSESSKGTSKGVITRLPSNLGEEAARGLSTELLGQARGFPERTPANIGPNIAGDISGQLQSRLLGAPTSLGPAQNSLLQQALGQVNANQAQRGLTTREQPSITSQIAAIAPLLNQVGQQEIGNLQAALTQQQGATLNQTQVLQQGENEQAALIAQIFSDIIGSSLDQIIVTNDQKNVSRGFSGGFLTS